MSNTLGYGMTLNTGTYFGGGYTGATQKTGSTGYNNRVASSTNLNRIARDLSEGYYQALSTIDLYFKKGDVNKALASYDSLFEQMKETATAYGYQLSDGQIASELDKAFQKATGTSFTYAVVENTHSSFVTGLIEGIPIIGQFANGNSDMEALSKLDGTEVSARDKVAEKIGAVVPGAAVAVAGACAASGIGIPIALAIGAGMGILGLITTAVKNK